MPRAAEWRLTAQPYPWGIQDAFDNSLATFWLCGETLKPGQSVQVDFHGEQTADSVVLEAAPNQWAARLKLEGQDAAGRWQLLAAAPKAGDAPRPLGLRRAVAGELKRRGIDYLLVFDTDNGAEDLRLNADLWGIRAVGDYKGSETLPITMRLFLGVDGGQSGTTAVIGDETGRVLGTGEAGPCNHAAAGEGRAKLERAVTGSVAAACAQAGLDAATVRFEAACFGMSGGPDDKREILAATLRTERLVVTNDAVIALAGATRTGQGIITIAGTGSIAFGRNPAGRTSRAGGWGYVFGDEGGGFDIARQATRAALRLEEGWGPPTVLRETLLAATGAENANQMLHLFYTDEWPRSRVATLARLVDAAALESDARGAGDPAGRGAAPGDVGRGGPGGVVGEGAAGGDRLHWRGVSEPDAAGELPDAGGVAGGRALRCAAARSGGRGAMRGVPQRGAGSDRAGRRLVTA